jgi:pimeloyl-ACP methyl ester carboxylesterase
MSDPAEVILVHGLWYRAWSMRVLRRRLELAGFGVRSFSYPTRTSTPETNAEALRDFAVARPASQLHFVAHSLGGLLVLLMLRKTQVLPPGRIVLLGSPLRGSAVARRISDWPGFGFMLGQAADLLCSGSSTLPPDRPTGMIAGVRPVGLGRFAGRLDAPHDGTVSVAETESVDLAARIELPVTHTGMLVSRAVAEQAACFLHEGCFARQQLE